MHSIVMSAARNAPPPFRGCKVRPAFQVRVWLLLLSDPYAALGAAALDLGLCSLTTTTRNSARRARGCVRASDGSDAGAPWVLGGKNARVCRAPRCPSAAVVQSCHGARRGSVRRALRLDREANGLARPPRPPSRLARTHHSLVSARPVPASCSRRFARA